MSTVALDITCPGCGAPVNTSMETCPYCKRPVVISTFNSVYSMPMPEINKYAGTYRKILAEDPDNQQINNSIAMCYLKLKLYDKALDAFEKAMEDNFDNSETFFYAAICMLKGGIPFTQSRETILKIIEYIQAALMIEPKGIYYYFLAYVKYDYYERKYLNTTPNYAAVLADAKKAGLSAYDVDQLWSILGVARPSRL